MAWIRYPIYFVAIALVTWGLTQLELSSPGSLKLHILLSDTDVYGTSEFSPVEIIQAIILFACGVIMAWVARYCPSQRQLAERVGGRRAHDPASIPAPETEPDSMRGLCRGRGCLPS